MPRTIESIAENHEAANVRRRHGLPIWGSTVTIKNLLSDDTSDENAVVTAEKVAGVLEGSAWYTTKADEDDRWDLDCIIDSFKYEVSTVDDFNEFLDALYDLADAERVWIN